MAILLEAQSGPARTPSISRMLQRMNAPDLMPQWISVGSGDSMFSDSRTWRLSPKPSQMRHHAPMATPLQFQSTDVDVQKEGLVDEPMRASPWLSRPKNGSPQEALETLSRLGVKPKTVRTSTGLYVNATEAKKMGVTIPREVPGRGIIAPLGFGGC